MPAFNTQQDLIAYITDLERRIALLEQSATRIDKTTARASVTGRPGKIIFDTTAGRLYAGDNSGTWNALW
jgi:hypothetical protein